MRSWYTAHRSFCLLLGTCAACMLACTGLPNIGPGTSTGSVSLGVPPSVAAFCPSPATLAPILGETVTLDYTTGTHGSDTICGYTGPTGDVCEFTISAWTNAQYARQDYTGLMNNVVRVGGQVQTLTSLGDAAFYWVDEQVDVLKGSDDLFDKCFFLPPRQHAVDEQVDVQIAQLLLTRI
jgi:hypothetical protein